MTPLTEPTCAPQAEPAGFLKPVGKRELLAVKALDEGRLSDAAGHVAALPEGSAQSRAWKLYLRGQLQMKRRDLAAAESDFLQAAAVAFVWGFSDGEEERSAFRLAAAALENAGMMQRRGERGAEAIATHSAAYRLRVEHGTVEEQWESALSQGMACHLAKDYAAALHWYERALGLAKEAVEARMGKEAMTLSQLSATYRESGQLDRGVAAAREAMECRRRHDVTTAAAAEAEYRLGDVLVAQAEQLVGDERPVATILTEAVKRLESASEALAAFGKEYERTARLGRERLEFAQRLLASCGE